MEKVIIVNKNDCKIGTKEKLEAHKKGFLHRAFSVFVLNHENKLLLQKRAASKYHSAGLWSNTCCGHPRPRENTADAAHRRLYEEMGFDCALSEIFDFHYNTRLDHGLRENEIDHVFVGVYNGTPIPNPEEVQEFEWVDIKEISHRIEEEPDNFTYWFKIALHKIAEK